MDYITTLIISIMANVVAYFICKRFGGGGGNKA